MMTLRCKSSGQAVQCHTLLGKGGEGEVYKTDINGMVAKIYHQGKTATSDIIEKLQYMLHFPPDQPPSSNNHIAITWPQDLLEANGVIRGFLMNTSDGTSIDNAMLPIPRKKNLLGLTWHHGIVMSYNLSWVMENIHAKGYVIGDVNTQNIRVLPEGLISIIDTDSFQISDPVRNKTYPCTVITPEYAAPELTPAIARGSKRRPEQDCFSLAVIIYGLLMCGNHPFSGVYNGSGDPPERSVAIKNGFSIFDPSSPYSPRPASPPLALIPPPLMGLFKRCFLDGYSNPGQRPTARDWIDALEPLARKQGIVDCPNNNLHVYPQHLKACPWCELWNRIHIDYYDPRGQSQRGAQGSAQIPAQQINLSPRSVAPAGTGGHVLPQNQPQSGGGTPAPSSSIKWAWAGLIAIVVAVAGYLLSQWTPDAGQRVMAPFTEDAARPVAPPQATYSSGAGIVRRVDNAVPRGTVPTRIRPSPVRRGNPSTFRSPGSPARE